MIAREEVVQMAIKVVGDYSSVAVWPCDTEELLHFAELVAAAEREACAKACEELRAGAESNAGKIWLTGAADAIRARGTP